MASEQIDYRQVGRDLYEAIRRLGELLRQHESKQWPPGTPERFDTGLIPMVANPGWRQGSALSTDAQKGCATALEAAGMSAVAARRVSGFQRDHITE